MEESAGGEPKAEVNSEEPLAGDAGMEPNGRDVEVLHALAWTGACAGPNGEEKLTGVAPNTAVVFEKEGNGEIPTSGLARATLFPNSEAEAGWPKLCAGPKLKDGELLNALPWTGSCIVPNLGGVGAENAP